MNNNVLQPILCAMAVIAVVLAAWLVLSPAPATIIYQQQPYQQQQAPPPNYPLNMEITSYIGNSELDEDLSSKPVADKLISVVHKVSYDEEKSQFVYSYKLTSAAKQPVFLSWEVLTNWAGSKSPILLQLTPGKVQEHTYYSNFPPAFYDGQAVAYIKTGDTVWKLIPLKAQPAPLPKQNY